MEFKTGSEEKKQWSLQALPANLIECYFTTVFFANTLQIDKLIKIAKLARIELKELL